MISMSFMRKVLDLGKFLKFQESILPKLFPITFWKWKKLLESRVPEIALFLRLRKL